MRPRSGFSSLYSADYFDGAGFSGFGFSAGDPGLLGTTVGWSEALGMFGTVGEAGTSGTFGLSPGLPGLAGVPGLSDEGPPDAGLGSAYTLPAAKVKAMATARRLDFMVIFIEDASHGRRSARASKVNLLVIDS